MPKRSMKAKHTALEDAEEYWKSSDDESACGEIHAFETGSEACSADSEDDDSEDSELKLDESDTEWEPVKKSLRRSTESEEQRGTFPLHTSTSTTPPAVRAALGAVRRGRGKGRGRGKQTYKAEDGTQWQSTEVEDILPPQPAFKPRRPPGPQLITGASYSVLQLFQQFISNSILQTIIHNTNKYGRRRHDKKWKEVTLEDMYSYLSVIIYMGLAHAPALKDYWCRSELYNFPFLISTMSGQRFMSISTNLHLSDPDEDDVNDTKKGTPQYDRLCKIQPMYNDIRECCKANFHPYQDIAVDERMVASKARISFLQYMKDKPAKWGYKLFVLADSQCGYTWDFFIYQGKRIMPSDKGLSYHSVMDLVSPAHLGTGYKLFVDNYYTSPALFQDLLKKRIWACGTIRGQRMGRFRNRPGGVTNNDPRGTIRWIREGPIVFVQWKDSRVVHMCSTLHQAHAGRTIRRRVKNKSSWNVLTLPVPPAVEDYNKSMGGVDLSDALIGYYSILRKTKRWYRSFFYHFVDIGIVNAYILQKEVAKTRGERPLTQKAFREKLIQELHEVGSTPTRIIRPRPPRGRSAGRHLPMYTGSDATASRRRCQLCQKKTPIVCRSCNAALCVVPSRNCFSEWHTKNEL